MKDPFSYYFASLQAYIPSLSLLLPWSTKSFFQFLFTALTHVILSYCFTFAHAPFISFLIHFSIFHFHLLLIKIIEPINSK